MFKRTFCFICCILLMISFSSCNKAEEQSNISSVATVDGENIDEAYFKYYFIELKNLVQLQYGESSWQSATLDGKPALEYVRERALDAAVEDKIIMSVAKNEGISLTDEDKNNIEKTKQQWISQFGSESAFVDAIKNKYGLTLEQFNYMLEAVHYRNHIVNKYVNDSQSRKYYDNNIVKVKHILIPTVELGSNIPLTADELKVAEGKLSTVLSEIQSGKDFDSLVPKYTKDQDVFYYIGTGFSINADGSMGSGMVAEFESSALSLGVGEISDAVESPYGYHIIKRYENDDAMYNISKDTLASMVFTDILEEWKSQKNIVINYDIYNSYS